ncbi:O-antigen ligase family protein [Lachnospiraceae bacterium 62-35]
MVGTENGSACLIDHYLIVCIFLSLFILTLVGVGDVLTVSMLGLLLCAAGFVQQSAQVDLWIFVPLVVYNLASMASSYAIYGNITDGYASIQSVFPVLYLLRACLDRKEQFLTKQLAIIWVGIGAAAGIGQFVFHAAAQGSAGRMGGLLGNPNAMGIFLAAGWFALMNCIGELEEKGGFRFAFLSYIEPLLLAALAMTLSMGSFVAMASGILVVLILKKRQDSYQETFQYACRILAKASLGMGTGMLMYLAAARTNMPWSCLLLLPYLLMAVICWKKFGLFLAEYPHMAAVISALGVLVAALAVAVRPSSIATSAERLEMMRNGLHYLTQNPLLGVGPYQWRLLNLYDSDKYFNTWHIHNVLLHVGVEFGWIAMGMLALIVVRFYRKKAKIWEKGGFTAFCIHNLMDTSFFYMGITSLVLLTAGDPEMGGKKVGSIGLKTIFGSFALMFAYNLYRCIQAV